MTEAIKNIENSRITGEDLKELIGIVTVLFNSDDVLPGFFESLASQRGVRYRLYVIDNSQTDSGSRLCRELAKFHNIDAVVFFNDANLGVARGNNQGIEQAMLDDCKKVLLANNDIEFRDPDLLKNMVMLTNYHGLDAVVPKIYYHSDSKRIWCAGGRFSLYAATTPHFGEGEIDNGQYDTAQDIDYAPTCFMLLRSELFREVGIMDERYFVYYDDTDFMWRMKRAGKRLHYWPKGQVWHKVSFSTGGSESLFSLYYGYRNRIIFIRKNYPAMLQVLSVGYVYATLVIKFFRFDCERRKAVRCGLHDGFSIQL